MGITLTATVLKAHDFELLSTYNSQHNILTSSQKKCMKTGVDQDQTTNER